AGENEIRMAFADVLIAGVDRLHAGAAVDLHGEGGHGVAHAHPQRGDASRVHLVRDDADAAEDDLVEGAGRERLAQERGPPATDREMDGRERPGRPAGPDEWGAAAVGDVDRPAAYSAAVGRRNLCDGPSPSADRASRGASASGAKSSTATAA